MMMYENDSNSFCDSTPLPRGPWVSLKPDCTTAHRKCDRQSHSLHENVTNTDSTNPFFDAA